MKKQRHLICFLAAGFFALSHAAWSEVQVVVKPEGESQIKQRYVVIRKDTLWDIADLIYGDPFVWKTIHAANEGRIADPDLIYPGEILILPDVSKAEVMAKAAAVVVPIEEESPVEEKIVPEEPAAPGERGTWGAGGAEPAAPPQQAAVAPPAPEEPLEAQAPTQDETQEVPPKPAAMSAGAAPVMAPRPESGDYDGQIISAKESRKMMLSQGDEVFIDLGHDHGLVAGDKLDIVRRVKRVIHPATKQRFWIIEKLGRLKVTSEIFNKRARCRILYSHQDVAVGDGVLRLASAQP